MSTTKKNTRKPAVKRAIGIKDGMPINMPDIFSAANPEDPYVSEQSALGLSAFWCGVKVISEGIGTLPVTVYKSNRDGTREQADHYLADILDGEPNPEMSARQFWESFVANCLIFGNGFAEIVRTGDGSVSQLWLLHPAAVQVDRDQGGRLVYRATGSTGSVTDLDPTDVLHVAGLSCDGIQGWNPLQIARESLAFSMSADEFGRAYFRNSGSVGTYLQTPAQLTEQARENVLKSFRNAASGVRKTGVTYLLEEGLTANRQQLSNEAGQYDETRRFQISEVSRLLNISPVHLHELGRATWGNLGALKTDLFDSTFKPWVRKIEAELNRKTLTPNERRKHYVEFDADTLLRGDITTRYAAYKVGLDAGFLTKDEVRQWENLPPLPDEPTPEPVIVQPLDGVQPVQSDTPTEVNNGNL